MYNEKKYYDNAGNWTEIHLNGPERNGLDWHPKFGLAGQPFDWLTDISGRLHTVLFPPGGGGGGWAGLAGRG